MSNAAARNDQETDGHREGATERASQNDRQGASEGDKSQPNAAQPKPTKKQRNAAESNPTQANHQIPRPPWPPKRTWFAQSGLQLHAGEAHGILRTREAPTHTMIIKADPLPLAKYVEDSFPFH